MVLDDLEFALKTLQYMGNIERLVIFIDCSLPKVPLQHVMKRFEIIPVALLAKHLSLTLRRISTMGPTDLDSLWINHPQLTSLTIDIRGIPDSVIFQPCRLPSLKQLRVWTWGQISVGLGSPIEKLTISYFSLETSPNPRSMDSTRKMLTAMSPTLLQLHVEVWGPPESSTSALVFFLEQCPNLECVEFHSQSNTPLEAIEFAQCTSIISALHQLPQLKYLGLLYLVEPGDFEEFSTRCFDVASNLHLIAFGHTVRPISRLDKSGVNYRNHLQMNSADPS